MADLVIDAIAAVGVASSTLVNVELTDGRGDPVVGYVTGTDNVIVLPTTVTTDENGEVTIDLIPNADIVPGNTCYTVRIAHKQFLIQKSGVTQNLFEALVNDPGDLDPITTDFLLKANNLSDLEDVAEARTNLELGNSATRDVGTIAGTVAAGDDVRFDIAPDHIANPTDAHDATAISFSPTVGIPADDVQEAIEYVWDNAGGGGGTNDHNALINRGAADQHPASSVTNTPAGSIAATHVQGAINELDGDIQGHITDTTDAHDASAISVVPFATITSTDVQDALQQVYASAVSGLDEASEISFAPTGDIVATNVQAAIVEVDGELHAHEALATDAHDASAISFVPTGGITSTTAQAAIVESLNDSIAYTDGVVASYVLKDGSYSPGSVDVLKGRITGDANPRFTLNADGSLEWADGTLAIDTNLYRSAANVLKTDDTFNAVALQLPNSATALQFRNSANTAYLVGMSMSTNQGIIGQTTTWTGVDFRAATGGSYSFNTAAATDIFTISAAFPASIRLGTTQTLVVNNSTDSTTAAGGIAFGTSRDTNLYRSAADTLKTDDSFVAATNSAIGGSPSSNQGLSLGGTVNNAGAGVFALYTGGITLAPATASAANFLYGGGGTVSTGTSVNRASAVFSATISKSGAGTVDATYGLYAQAQTAGTANYGIATETQGTAGLWLSLNTNPTTQAGGILFGQSQDTNLYRSAADTLKTDDVFLAATAVAIGSAPAGAGTLRLTNGSLINVAAGNTFSMGTGGGARFTVTDTNLTFADAANIAFNGGTGTKIGESTGQKFAFHGSTPVIQRAGAAQAAVATTASTNVTPFGYTTAAQADSIVTLLNEIRAVLVEKGLMKGSA